MNAMAGNPKGPTLQLAHPHVDGQPPPKRRKVPLACNACRDRKSRCDGKRPICSACQKKKTATECVYEESTLRTQRDISILENRVRELESNASPNGLGGSDLPAPISDNFLYQDDVRTSDVRYLAKIYGKRSESSAESAQLHAKVRTEAVAIDSLTTGPIDEDSAHLFGTSVTARFMHSLKQTISSPHDIQISDPVIRDCRTTVIPNRNIDTTSYFLPTRKQADRYLNCVWEYVQPVTPILHKPSFTILYQSIWTSSSEQSQATVSAIEDPIFLSTLSIVFALGCQYDETVEPSTKTILAERFYNQSRKLLAMDDLDSVSLLVVQLLLLTGIYLLNSKYINRCWNVIGLAVRNAQTLGLHEEHGKQSWNQMEREMRRRVWYNCVFHDRLVATIFGRPHMISSPSTVPKPVLIDDEYLLLNNEGQQPTNIPSYLGLFLQSLNLFDIMSEVVILHHNRRESSTKIQSEPQTSWWHSHHLDSILRIDRTLDNFIHSLPPHLRTRHDAPPNANKMQWRQAKILQCRILYIRALLLRPLLLSFAHFHTPSSSSPLTKIPSTELGENVALQICTKCILTIHELVTALHSALHVNYQSPEWVSHYTFSCAMVLAAARICGFQMEGSGEAEIKSSWEKCIGILMHYRERIPSAPYAVGVLECLLQRANSKGAGEQFLGVGGENGEMVGEGFGFDFDWVGEGDWGDWDLGWMGQI